MPGTPARGDRWETKVIPLEGGLILNSDSLVQGAQKPGSAITGINFEPNINGGYRRVSGFQKYDTNAGPGTGPILGAFVFNDGVVIAQNGNFYKGSGSGWGAKINTDLTRTTPNKVRAAKYNWVRPSIILADGANLPAKYDSAGTYTVLSAAPSGATYVEEHKFHIFFTLGTNLSFSAPNDETKYDAPSGGGVINVGRTITGLKKWRGNLYIFCQRQIFEITGSNASDFALVPVTDDLGCIAGDTIQEVGGDLIYLSNDGLRTLGGTNRIGDVELATVSKEIQTVVTDLSTQYAAAGSISSLIVRSKSQYRVFGNLSSTPDNIAQGIVAGLRQPENTTQVPFYQDQLNWEFFQLQGIRPYCCDSDYINATELVIHGGYDGFVYQQESGTSFGGANIPALFQTPYIPFDDPSVRKTFYKGALYLGAEGATTLTVQLLFDFGDPTVPTPSPILVNTNIGSLSTYDTTAQYDVSKYDGNPFPQALFNLVGSGRTASLQVFSNDTNPSYSLRAVALQYGLGGRR